MGGRMTVDDIFDALYLQAKEINGLTKLRDYVFEHESVNCLSFEREGATAIGFIKVVRCKDCKWYEWGLTECHNPRYGDGWANYPPPQVYDEYFCKDGERKDEVEE